MADNKETNTRKVPVTTDEIRAMMKKLGAKPAEIDAYIRDLEARGPVRKRGISLPTVEDYGLALALFNTPDVSKRSIADVLKDIGVSPAANRGAMSRIGYLLAILIGPEAIQKLVVNTNKKSESPISDLVAYSAEAIAAADFLATMGAGEKEEDAKPVKAVPKGKKPAAVADEDEDEEGPEVADEEDEEEAPPPKKKATPAKGKKAAAVEEDDEDEDEEDEEDEEDDSDDGEDEEDEEDDSDDGDDEEDDEEDEAPKAKSKKAAAKKKGRR